MSDPIFEHYKEALKAGHVSVLRGRLDEALAHYRRAAEIADERPLPHASQGGVLLRLGRVEEALAAYSRALGRAPRDEGALTGRAEALQAAGRTGEAAEVLERLASVLAETERVPEALAVLQRALALKETKRRRRRAERLAAQLGVEVAPAPTAPVTPAEADRGPAEPAADASSVAPLDADTATLAVEPALEETTDTVAEEPAAAEASPAEEESPAAEGSSAAEAQPADGEALLAAAEEALVEGDEAAALAALVAAAEAYASADAPDAALDALQAALRLDPGSAAVHLAMARLYLARGWGGPAVEKLALLDRLAIIEGRDETRLEIGRLAAEQVALEPALAQLAGAADEGAGDGLAAG
ncbi:MAG TPA: tetratricopeptide repeat protein [Candidatus Limnocylindrales bacterium]|nr:tetratricopeptide repeat protein [Candidatus Limnocylindrales bacterium]